MEARPGGVEGLARPRDREVHAVADLVQAHIEHQSARVGVGRRDDVQGDEVHVDEHEVSRLLSGLAKIGITYTQIFIDKPRLEDYFLHISKNNP